jgi:hypothetical protein
MNDLRLAPILPRPGVLVSTVAPSLAGHELSACTRRRAALNDDAVAAGGATARAVGRGYASRRTPCSRS